MKQVRIGLDKLITKSMLAVIAIWAVLFVVFSDGHPLKPSKLYLSQRRPGRDVCPSPEHPVGIDRIQEQYFTQYIDQVGKTGPLQQRFWQNDQWYKPGGPQFLMLGGEASISSAWVERDDLEWTSLAKQVGARVFLLEHRFYGKSQPSNVFPVISTLFDYLNTQQAASDVVAFIAGQNTNLGIINQRWILFGGSYAGALAAWIREKHPEVVYAAVASSAPVQAVVNFKGYLEGVYNVLHSYDPKCADSVHKGFNDFNGLMQTSLGRMSLKDTFRLCNDITNIDDNTRSFIYEAIIEGFERVVQFSEVNVGDYATKITVPELCKRQLGADSDLDGLASINTWMLFEDNKSCLDTDYSQYIQDLQTGQAGNDSGDYRAWFYQQCNELGFFRSTDSDFVSNKFTGADIPIDYYLQQCQHVFSHSFTNASIYGNIEKTNAYYYGQNGYNGTRVAFLNGSDDPYQVLSVVKAANEEVYPSIVAGTSHCADMYPASPNDKPGLTAARQTIRSLVLKWATTK